MSPENPSIVMSPGQRRAAETLRPIIRLGTVGIKPFLPLKPRTNTLIAGRSGTGKSHLVRLLAAEANLPIWEANMSSWIVLGARNGRPTLDSLVEWIAETGAGIIFLDEIEKISSPGSDWYHAIRLELHSLCDYLIPVSGFRSAGMLHQQDSDRGGHPDESRSMTKAEVEAKLSSSFMIIGAGAWQPEWTGHRNTIGFHPSPAEKRALDRQQLLSLISPEILQRFRQEVVFLEPMTPDDYLAVMSSQSALLPLPQRRRFEELVASAIPKAVEHGLGMRIFEEIYTDFCIEWTSRLAANLGSHPTQ